MTPRGSALAKAAGTLIGTPFRLHGRSAENGVDCVGLVACSLERIGEKPIAPTGYRLRNSCVDRYLAFASANKLDEASGLSLPGDIILVSPGPAQHHLVIVEDRQNHIHAHAGLGKVVRMPGPIGWPIEKRWRLSYANGVY